MTKYLPLLLDSPLFTGLTADQVRALLRDTGARVRRYAKDSYLLAAGEKAASVCVLLCGSAQVVQEDYWGNRNLLAMLTPGRLFAESFACAGRMPLNVSVVAASPCEALLMDVELLLSLQPGGERRLLVLNLLRELAHKNILLNSKITHMAKRTTRQKLLSFFSQLALDQGGATLTLPFNRQQMADYLCVDRSAMCAEMSRLRDEGIIRYERSRVQLIKPHKDT